MSMPPGGFSGLPERCRSGLALHSPVLRVAKVRPQVLLDVCVNLRDLFIAEIVAIAAHLGAPHFVGIGVLPVARLHPASRKE